MAVTNLVLGQVIGKVGNHDLGLGRNAIGGGTALTTLASRAGLGFAGLVSLGLVGDILQSINLISWGIGTLSAFLLLLVLFTC